MSTVPLKQEDHPAHNMPTASEHYAGDVVPMGSYFSSVTTANTQQRNNDAAEGKTNQNPPAQVIQLPSK